MPLKWRRRQEKRKAYAQAESHRAKAVEALRQYEPLVLHSSETCTVLNVLGEVALKDAEAANAAKAAPHLEDAIDHLKTAIEEAKPNHAEAAKRHVVRALLHLEAARKDVASSRYRRKRKSRMGRQKIAE